MKGNLILLNDDELRRKPTVILKTGWDLELTPEDPRRGTWLRRRTGCQYEPSAEGHGEVYSSE